MKQDHLRVGVSLEPFSPEWYARRAIRVAGLSQAGMLKKCFGAAFGALGAAQEGDFEQMEKFIRDGQIFFDTWAAIARNHCSHTGSKKRSVSTAPKVEQASITGPVTVEKDIDLEEEL